MPNKSVIIISIIVSCIFNPNSIFQHIGFASELHNNENANESSKEFLTSNEIQIKYNLYIKQLNQYFESHNIDYKIPNNNNPKKLHTFNRYYREKEFIIKDGSSEFSFLSDNNRLIRFYNRIANNILYGPKGVLYDSETKPLWKKEQAIENSKIYLKLFLEDFKKNIILADAVYSHNFMEYPKYYKGMWIIYWTRTDNNEIKYQNDCISTLISESHGLLLFSYNFWSIYDENTSKIITKKPHPRRHINMQI